MISLTKRLHTTADYQATPEGPPWYQLVEGELVMEPSPNLEHQETSVALTVLLAGHVRLHRLGWIYAAPLDVYLSDYDVFQPDLIFVSNERAAIMAEEGIHGAPDLAVEILSPSSASRDRGQKFHVYREAGVKEFWLIDPGSARLQAHDFSQNPAKPARAISRKGSFTSPLFPGLTIAGSDIFER